MHVSHSRWIPENVISARNPHNKPLNQKANATSWTTTSSIRSTKSTLLTNATCSAVKTRCASFTLTWEREIIWGIYLKGSCQKCGNFWEKRKMCDYKIHPASHRHTCYLYSGCEVFTTDCEDCTTGKLECDICTFENMLPDGSCGMDFTHFSCANKKTRSWVIMNLYKLNRLLLFISTLV